jgi:thymidylate synthase ThyX
MQHAEDMYFGLLEFGESPQIARSVLPTCLKTEIVMTANFREWRHVFKLRCAKAAHPQIRELMFGLLKEVNTNIPVIFEDLYKQFLCEKWEDTPLLKKLEGKEAKKVAVLIESKPVDLPDMPKAPPIELIKENGKKINDVFQICTNRKTKLHSIRKNGYLF